MSSRVLVTGGAGYVGAGLLRHFLKEGYEVICADNLRFGGEAIIDILDEPNFSFEKCDLTRPSDVDALFDAYTFDSVIHLAAIVGDPACSRESDLANKTNWDASVYLVNKCKEKGVRKFAFASTCSNYGKMKDANAYVDESSDLAPVSLYAELKVKFENFLMDESTRTKDFVPTALRFSTVYGMSPRMRFDLTVNEFTKELALGRELVVFGEQFWRPYCHVNDFSRAFMAVLEAPENKVAYQVFNVGDTSENYTKKMLVDEMLKVMPDAQISYVKKDEDPRDYRVNSDKIKRELDFEISKTVPDGIREVYMLVSQGVVQDPDDQRYYNIPHTRPE